MTADHRACAAVAPGVLVGVVLAFFVGWQSSALASFDAAAITFAVATWFGIRTLDPGQTESRARHEDGSAGFVGTAVILSSLIALVLEVLGLVKAEDSNGAARVLLISLAVSAVIAGWLAIQAVYTLHYARLYFADDRRGIDFNTDEAPDFGDFLYFTVTIAMTYQVSDTEISDRRIRRVVTRHAMLSFLFGTAIIGTTINIMASLVGN